jgi:hypothetical protein
MTKNPGTFGVPSRILPDSGTEIFKALETRTVSRKKKDPGRTVLNFMIFRSLGFELMHAEVKVKIDVRLKRLVVNFSYSSFRACKIWGEGGFPTNLAVSCLTFVKLRPDFWFS